MLFDVGEAYSAMLVPVPFHPGVKTLLLVDDLLTIYWVHSVSTEDQWEKLGKYKWHIELGCERYYAKSFSVHFSDKMQSFLPNLSYR